MPGANLPKDMVFRNGLVETKDASDFFASASWSKGSLTVKFERAAEVRRYNGVTYSDAYEEDVAKLSLSSFNASLTSSLALTLSMGLLGTSRTTTKTCSAFRRISCLYRPSAKTR